MSMFSEYVMGVGVPFILAELLDDRIRLPSETLCFRDSGLMSPVVKVAGGDCDRKDEPGRVEPALEMAVLLSVFIVSKNVPMIYSTAGSFSIVSMPNELKASLVMDECLKSNLAEACLFEFAFSESVWDTMGGMDSPDEALTEWLEGTTGGLAK
jgi:hypothetical protein